MKLSTIPSTGRYMFFFLRLIAENMENFQINSGLLSTSMKQESLRLYEKCYL